jgi:hypothetical protein
MAEEDIAAQRSPISPQMVTEILRVGKMADPLSLDSLMLDVVVISREIGPRLLRSPRKCRSGLSITNTQAAGESSRLCAKVGGKRRMLALGL